VCHRQSTMPCEKFTRASLARIVICFLCLPSVISIERSLSLEFNNCDRNPNNDEDGCSQCWTSDFSTDTLLPQEATNVIETPCPSAETSLKINNGTDEIWDWPRPPGGWAINDRDDFKCNVDANVDWSETINASQVAVVVQLCNVDETTLCQPVVPPKDYFLTSETNNGIQTETPQISVTKFINLDIKGTIDLNVEFDFGTVPTGLYRIMGSLIFSNQTNLLGVSNIPDGQFLIVVHDEPLEVSSVAFTAVIVFSGAASALILFLLCQTFSNRNAQVFELTQGKFLMAMQVCALVATCSLVLFKPDDPFCQLSALFIYLPTHMVYAILLGRMWRVRAIISPLLLITLEKKEHWTPKIVNWVNRFTACTGRQNQQQKKIRMKITEYQLARVIFLLIMPQLVVQILILVVYYDNKMVLIDISYDGLVDGIYTCEYGVFNFSTLHAIAISLIGVEFLMLMLLTHGSKDLPSLFNETKKVWSILSFTFVLVVSGSLLIAATIDHHVTANVRFLVPAFVLGFNMIQTCWVITWSKLKVAWSGQIILVTKLIADHNFKKTTGMGNDLVSSSDPSDFSFIKRFSISPPKPYVRFESPAVQMPTYDENKVDADVPDDRSTDSSVLLMETQETVLDDLSGDDGIIESSLSLGIIESSRSLNLSQRSGTSETRRRRGFSRLNYFRSGAYQNMRVSQQELTNRGSMVIRRRIIPHRESAGLSAAVPYRPEDREGLAQRNRFSIFGRSSAPTSVMHESTIAQNPRLSDSKIRISETEAPGRRLLLRMIDVQRTLTKINTALLTGKIVSKEDWEDVRGGCIALGSVFEREVQFGWEDGIVEVSESSDLTEPPSPVHKPSNNARPMASSLRAPKPAASSADRKSVNFGPSNAPASQNPARGDSVGRSLLTNAPLETIKSGEIPRLSPTKEIEKTTVDVEHIEYSELSDGIALEPGIFALPISSLESKGDDACKDGIQDGIPAEEVPQVTSPVRKRGSAGMVSMKQPSIPSLGSKGDDAGNYGSSGEEVSPITIPVRKRGSEGMVSMKQPSKRDMTLSLKSPKKVVPEGKFQKGTVWPPELSGLSEISGHSQPSGSGFAQDSKPDDLAESQDSESSLSG
jgi:hypothetical protein